MAKKKKTRHQKIIADSRRQAFTIKPEKTSEDVLTVKESTGVKKEEKPVGKYSYLASDLKKTAIATSCIFAFQIIFFFLLTRNIIEIPGLNY